MRIILLFLICLPAAAQNYAVKFAGNNTNGLPYYWPETILDASGPTVQDGFVLLSRDQVNFITFTNAAAMRAALASTSESKRLQKVNAALSVMNVVITKAQAIQDGWATNSAQRLTLLRDLKDSIDKLAIVYSRVTELIKDNTEL